MASNAIIGVGVQFQRGDGATPEVFTALAEIISVSGGEKADTADATSFSSTGGYKEFKSTLIDPGELKISMHSIPGDAQQLLLYADMRARTVRNFKIVQVSGHTRSFAGIITEFAPDIKVDALQMAAMTVKVSGAISDT